MKESIIPKVMPSGLAWVFPAAEEESTIGNSGQIHGAKIVTSPARKAKPKSKIINSKRYSYLSLHFNSF